MMNREKLTNFNYGTVQKGANTADLVLLPLERPAYKVGLWEPGFVSTPTIP